MALNDITDYFVPFHVVARICRPFIFIDHFRNVRKIFAAILYAVPRISNVFVLLGVHILFFGIVANMFFAVRCRPAAPVGSGEGREGDAPASSPQHAPRPLSPRQGVDGNNCAFFENNSTDSQVAPKPNSGYQDGYCSSFARNCLDYYRTPTDSMLNLFLLLTTVNCPDIFVPVYTCSRYAAIFFIIYLMIGLYFLLSLVMAVAYTHCARLHPRARTPRLPRLTPTRPRFAPPDQHQASEKAVHRVQKRTWALDKAFAVRSCTDVVSLRPRPRAHPAAAALHSLHADSAGYGGLVIIFIIVFFFAGRTAAPGLACSDACAQRRPK